MRRMVLVTHGRSGSELLLEALRRHPEIEMSASLTWRRAAIGCRRPSGTGATTRTGATFLREVVYVDSGGRAVVGFKQLPIHARSGPGATAWDYVGGERDIDVLRLRRDNLLDVSVSLHTARRARVWHVRPGEAVPEVAPFAVEPAHAERYFCRLAELDRDFDARFSGHRVLEPSYARDRPVISPRRRRACSRFCRWRPWRCPRCSSSRRSAPPPRSSATGTSCAAISPAATGPAGSSSALASSGLVRARWL